MFETSQDILNVVKAMAVGSLAVFACWVLYYLAMILRQIFKVFKGISERLDQLDDLLTTLKEKIEHSTSYLLLIGEGVKKLVEVIKEHRQNKRKEEQDD
ncbi:hypothetical protein D6821_00115 [Candidatus Parcubacteria bacterium]|nr:MAG: hypothetical protein D6821_00115 [Candidatus Parcubacteria bacterium]